MTEDQQALMGCFCGLVIALIILGMFIIVYTLD